MKNKQITCFILALLLVVTGMPFYTFAQEAEENKKESIKVEAQVKDEEPSKDDIHDFGKNNLELQIGLKKEQISSKMETRGFKDKASESILPLKIQELTSLKSLARRDSRAELDNQVDRMIKESQGYQVKTVPAPSFGTSSGEWTVFSLARSGADVDESYYDAYYNRVVTKLYQINGQDSDKYLEKYGVIDYRKPTENGRLIVALSSIGKDARNVGGFNLIEGLADIDIVTSQPGNGPCWALLALDSKKYPEGENKVRSDKVYQTTRNKLIENLLKGPAKKRDGGWSHSAEDKSSDIDITAMVITALAPYKDRLEVKQSINEGLEFLKNKLNATYDYGSVEANSWALIALVSLGRDPLTDPDFSKGEKNLISTIANYYVQGGGFKHSRFEAGADAMATDQALYGLTAYKRYREGVNSLFNMGDAFKEPVHPVGLSLDTSKMKTNYTQGEDVDYTGLKVYEVYSDGSKKELTLGNYVFLKKALTDHVGISKVVISKGSFEEEFSITVTNKEEPKREARTTIQLDPNNRQVILAFGQDFSLPKAKAIDSNGRAVNVDLKITYKGQVVPRVDSQKPGTYHLVYTASGADAVKMLVEVREKEVENAYLSLAGTYKTEFDLGDTLDLRGLEVYVVKTDGSKVLLNPGDYRISPVDMTQPGEKTLVISYQGLSRTLGIKVKNKDVNPSLLAIVDLPKTSYKQGDELDLSGLKARIYFDNGTFKDLEEKDVVTSYVNMYIPGKHEVTLYYLNQKASFTIEVKEGEKKGTQAYISVVVPPGPPAGYEAGKTLQAKKAFEIVPGKDTAYSILQRTGLSLNTDGNTKYAGVYVRSIDGLGEFDGGPDSGWMYRVNGWFPNYSASLYTLKPGDYVEWLYTRDLGKDIGGYVEGREESKEAKNFTIRSAQGGVITPTGRHTIKPNESISINFKALPGYILSDILLDGQSIGRASSLRLGYKNIKDGSILQGVFKKERDLSQEQIEKLKKDQGINLPKDKKTEKPLTEKELKNPNRFTDVHNHWAYKDIVAVVQKGYFNGISRTKFGPDLPMTRSMFVTVLGRMSGDQTGQYSGIFTDVQVGSYYAPYVQWAKEKGITQGVEYKQFAPNKEITREEMASMLYRYMKVKNLQAPAKENLDLKDLNQVSDWAKEPVKAMNKMGLIKGRDKGLFVPKDKSTRAEVASLILRMDKLQEK